MTGASAGSIPSRSALTMAFSASSDGRRDTGRGPMWSGNQESTGASWSKRQPDRNVLRVICRDGHPMEAA
jgi:hypothetical protein